MARVNDNTIEELPPPTISKEQIDRLLDSLKNSSSTNNTPTLQGRQVMIPFGRCAFWEGELQPKKITKKNGNNGSKSSSSSSSSVAGDEEEEVYVTTSSLLPSTSNDSNTKSMLVKMLRLSHFRMRYNGYKNILLLRQRPTTKRSSNQP